MTTPWSFRSPRSLVALRAELHLADAVDRLDRHAVLVAVVEVLLLGLPALGISRADRLRAAEEGAADLDRAAGAVVR